MPVSAPPPPPRIVASQNTDPNLISIVQWISDFYKSAILEGYFLNTVDQSKEDGGSGTSLPDPASTTLATAQKTANDAYILGQAAQKTADTANNRTKDWVRGTVTVSDLATTGTITFASAQTDTSFIVLVQPKSTSGSPPLDATLVIAKTYTTANCVFTLNAAPGTGKSVTFEWILIRGI